MGSGEVTLLLAGDALMTRPWSQVSDAAFIELVEEIRGADAAIVNLETVIHEFGGYAQRDPMGTSMASPPVVAGELRWAGFDMVAHANNHAFDYGSSAILETIGHAEAAGLILAGSGKDLQAARAPRYLESNGRMVALVSMTASYLPYGVASRSRPDMHGRPGVNPLAVTLPERAIVVPPHVAARLRAFSLAIGRKPERLADRSFRIGVRFHLGKSFGFERAKQDKRVDREPNLAAIAEAARNADIVVASIHAHVQGRWLREFAEDAIEQGADIVFVQGPHEVRAIGAYRGRPIFYGLGDFVYEASSVARLPAEFYERFGLGDEATPADAFAAARKRSWPVPFVRKVFEGVVASVSVAGDGVTRVRLTPIDLQYDAPPDRRGRPQVAAPALGRRIIEEIAALSRREAVGIAYDPASNRGEVALGGSR